MPLPTNPGERDGHAQEGGGGVDAAGGRKGPFDRANDKAGQVAGWERGEGRRPGGNRAGGSGGIGWGGAGGGGRLGGGSLPFTMKLFGDDGAELDTVIVGPLPWLPTEKGGIRAELVESFEVVRIDDGDDGQFLIHLFLAGGERAAVRGVFANVDEAAEFIDAAFPGAGFPPLLAGPTGA